MTHPFVLAMAGGSGSGKSTLAAALLERFPALRHIEHDAYYSPEPSLTPAQLAARNYDHPASLDNELLVDHLDAFRRGEGFEQPNYCFQTHSRQSSGGRRIEPARAALLEGILVLSEPRIARRIDFAVFVQTSEEVRLARRIDRDVRERGRTETGVRSQFAATVAPMHDRYVGPSQSQADLVVSGEQPIEHSLAEIVTTLRQKHPEFRESTG